MPDQSWWETATDGFPLTQGSRFRNAEARRKRKFREPGHGSGRAGQTRADGKAKRRSDGQQGGQVVRRRRFLPQCEPAASQAPSGADRVPDAPQEDVRHVPGVSWVDLRITMLEGTGKEGPHSIPRFTRSPRVVLQAITTWEVCNVLRDKPAGSACGIGSRGCRAGTRFAGSINPPGG